MPMNENEASEAYRETLQDIKYLEAEVQEAVAEHDLAKGAVKVAREKLEKALAKLRRKIRGEEEPDLFKNQKDD